MMALDAYQVRCVRLKCPPDQGFRVIRYVVVSFWERRIGESQDNPVIRVTILCVIDEMIGSIT